MPQVAGVILNGTTLIDLSGDTVAASNLVTNNTAHGADGEPVLGAAAIGGGIDVSDTTATPNRVRVGYFFHGADGALVEGTIPNLSSHTYYTSTSDQTISTSQFISGTQTIKAVTTSNISAANIKKGVTVKVGDSEDTGRIKNVTGTYAGPGVLLATKSLGTISTTDTNATDTGQTMTVSSLGSYDLLVVETSVNTVTNGRHTSTTSAIWLPGTTDITTKTGATIATARFNTKTTTAGVTQGRASTTAYGIYPYSCTISNNTATIVIYRRYNSTQTGTINGSYTMRVYGISIVDLIGG